MHESVFEEVDGGVDRADSQSQDSRVGGFVRVPNPNRRVQTVALDLNRGSDGDNVALLEGGMKHEFSQEVMVQTVALNLSR